VSNFGRLIILLVKIEPGKILYGSGNMLRRHHSLGTAVVFSATGKTTGMKHKLLFYLRTKKVSEERRLVGAEEQFSNTTCNNYPDRTGISCNLTIISN
jgi:hypothetical protein